VGFGSGSNAGADAGVAADRCSASVDELDAVPADVDAAGNGVDSDPCAGAPSGTSRAAGEGAEDVRAPGGRRKITVASSGIDSSIDEPPGGATRLDGEFGSAARRAMLSTSGSVSSPGGISVGPLATAGRRVPHFRQ
jgi:hypothetical protein